MSRATPGEVFEKLFEMVHFRIEIHSHEKGPLQLSLTCPGCRYRITATTENTEKLVEEFEKMGPATAPVTVLISPSTCCPTGSASPRRWRSWRRKRSSQPQSTSAVSSRSGRPIRNRRV